VDDETRASLKLHRISYLKTKSFLATRNLQKECKFPRNFVPTFPIHVSKLV
jgi:hypothetical protein